MDEDFHLPSAKHVVLRTAPILVIGLITIALVIVIYLVTPVPKADDPVWLTILALVCVGLLYVGAAIVIAVKISQAKHPLFAGVIALGVMISALIVLFALAYVSLSQTDASNFNVPLDKVSALYFTMTILSTTGFGDITAVSHKAMIVVMLQMVAGLTLFTMVARILVTVVKGATKRNLKTSKAAKATQSSQPTQSAETSH